MSPRLAVGRRLVPAGRVCPRRSSDPARPVCLAVSALLLLTAPAGMRAPAVQAPASPTEGASPAALVRILEAELARNVAALARQPDPLYFLAYTVHDSTALRLTAEFGALTDRGEDRGRTLTVDARVGSHDLDSTHQIPGDWMAGLEGGNRTSLPLVDDEQAIRHVAWLVTDRQFRRAAERFTRVKAAVAAKVQDAAPAPDFSREAPAVDIQPPPAPAALDLDAWANRLRRLSRPFASDPLVFHNRVSLAVERVTRTFVSSEGARVATDATWAHLQIQASTKAADGMELPLTVSFSSRALDGIPGEDVLSAAVAGMLERLAALRHAPAMDPFAGPAILSGRASAVFFHETFGHRIEGHRQKDVEEGQTFRGEIGQPILPPFLSVVSDPTRRTLAGRDLLGSYEYDDEGVKAEPVVVVTGGVLRAFLMGRSPIPGFPRSNGHGRAAPGWRPVSRQSNLIVESAVRTPDGELEERLREECRRQGKPAGLFFEQIEGGETYTGREAPNAFNVVPTLVYRVYADGRPKELVRGVDLIGTPLAAFGRILAAGSRVETFNGFCGAESGFVPVSASSPALLVSEVEVQRKPVSQETAPLLPAPPRRIR